MNKKNRILMLIVIVSTIIVTTVSISKYKTAVATNDTARTAVPAITVNAEPLNININPASNEQNYIFEVANYNGDKESEVSMEYSIKINNSKNLPLTFELYNYDENTKAKIGSNLLSQDNVTGNVSMLVGGKQANKYILKIKWQEDKKDYTYSKEIDYVQIGINSRQMN